MALFGTSENCIRFQSDGSLICTLCKAQIWCEHRNEFLTSYSDAPIWTTQYMNYVNTLGMSSIMVPLNPHLNIKANCKIEFEVPLDGEDGTEKTSVVWEFYEKVSTKGKRSNLISYNLGTLVEGEGMFTWAAQIWELFVGLHVKDAIRMGCLSTLHNKRSTVIYSRNLVSNETLYFSEAWNIATTSRCLNCDDLQSQWLEEDDLIPEVSTRGFPRPQVFRAHSFHTAGKAVDTDLLAMQALRNLRSRRGN